MYDSVIWKKCKKGREQLKGERREVTLKFFENWKKCPSFWIKMHWFYVLQIKWKVYRRTLIRRNLPYPEEFLVWTCFCPKMPKTYEEYPRKQCLLFIICKVMHRQINIYKITYVIRGSRAEIYVGFIKQVNSGPVIRTLLMNIKKVLLRFCFQMPFPTFRSSSSLLA